MSQVYPLDRVIRRVNTSRPLLDDSRGEQLVLINARRGRERVLQRKPFPGWGADLRALVVSSVASAQCEGPTCVVRDLPTGRSIELVLRYEARCAPGEAETLALKLGTHDNPQVHLNNLLRSWVDDLLRERKLRGEDVIGGFFEVRPHLEHELVSRARGVGLELQVVVELQGEADLEPFKVSIGPFAVKLNDYDEELSIRLKAELAVDPERKIQAVLRRGELAKLEARIRQRTRRFMLESVSLHDFRFALKDGVRTGLRRVLEELLAVEGRAVAHLVIDSVGLQDVEKNRTIEYRVRCKIKDPSEEVEVQNTLLLDLVDLGRWRMSGFATLEEWCEASLAPVVREQLFGCSYLDLLLEFAKPEKTIKELVRQGAAQVGYSVHHHIVLPRLLPLELRRGFSIELEEEFATLDSRIEVGLKVVFHGKISDLRKIKHLLSPRIDIEEEMKRAVLEVTKRVMHAIHPERFYMRFQHSDIADQIPVEEELKRAIREELEESFAVVDSGIILKVKETPLTKRVTDLCKGHHSFEFHCTPLRGGGEEEEVPFAVHLEVLGVRDWFTFYSKGYESADQEVEAIEEILAAELKSMLETVPQKQLQYRQIEDRTVISEHIFARAVEKIDEVFGLMVRIITMRRLPTVKERALLSVNASYVEQYELAEKDGLQKKLSYRLDEYDRLVERLKHLQRRDMEPDDEEIESLRKRIAELESEITQKSPEFGPKLITEGAGEGSQDVEWNSYGGRPSLIAGRRGRVTEEAEPGDG